MKTKFPTLIFVAVAAVGCAAPVQHDEAVGVSGDALTVQQCATRRDTCFQQNPLFGLFTCPGQYAQCLATASNGIPAQVTSAITDAVDCANTARACRIEAPTLVAQCNATEAECVAAIVDVRLPPVVQGAEKCVDDSVTCIRAAETVQNLTSCAQALQKCSFDNAVSALPGPVGNVVRDIGQCLTSLDMCVADAGSASALTECSQDEISCVAGSLDVPLVQPPVAEAVHCAETAADCALHATTVSAVQTCGANFRTCNSDLATAQLTCAQKWTACLAANPFNFLGCTATFATCTDG